jgi:hypothetical protein
MVGLGIVISNLIDDSLSRAANGNDNKAHTHGLCAFSLPNFFKEAARDLNLTLSIVGGDRGWKIFFQNAHIVEITYVTENNSLTGRCLFRA